MQYLIYILFRGFLIFLALIPMDLAYLFSDFLSFLLYYVIRYRKRVVLDNLRYSFPEKSEDEIRKIARNFYNHLADITVESIKGFTLTEKIIRKRYKIRNHWINDQYFDKNINTIAAGSHYGNWEWGTRLPDDYLKHKIIILYKPLTNRYIDEYMVRQRKKSGTEMVSIRKTRQIFTKNHDKPFTVILIGDQNPTNIKRIIWVRFLNRDTACLNGIENYSRIFNMPVIYFDIIKIRRGYYELDPVLIVDDPTKFDKGEITQLYMSRLEKKIREKPEYWLWSHKRWKHVKPAGNE